MFLYIKYFLVFLSISVLSPIRAMNIANKEMDMVIYKNGSRINIKVIGSNKGIEEQKQRDATNDLLEKKQLSNIKNLLQEGLDADPNLFEIGPLKRSAIWAAAEYNDIELLELLLERGVDINAGNPGTALHAAVRKGNNFLCKYLLEKGANPNMQNKCDDTPLDNAILFKNVSAIKSLIQYSANINDTQATKLKDTKFDLKKEYYPYIKTVLLVLKKCNAILYNNHDLRFLMLSYLPEYHCHSGLYKELLNRKYELKPFALHVVDGHTKIVQEILHIKNKNNKNILELFPSIQN